MRLASLHVGQDLILSGVTYRLIRILPDKECQLERVSDLALINRTKSELLLALASGELSFFDAQNEPRQIKNSSLCRADISSLSPEKQQVVIRRHCYVKEIENRLGENPRIQFDQFDEIIAIVAARLDDKNKPSCSTLYRWWRRWRGAGRDLISLADKTPSKGNIRRCFRGIVENEIHKAIEDVYLTRERHSCQAAYDALRYELLLLNKARTKPLRVPSRATFYRICANYDAYSVMAAREGKRAADRYFRSTGKGVEPQHILERVEIDHTPLDLMVVDDVTGLAIGRPTVTFLTDRFSRMPIGFEIGFEPPSELSVMAALRHAIMPKEYVNEEFDDIVNKWPTYGIPATLVCDNGLEFHSMQLRRMCAELNIELIFCPKKQPHYKGAIERYQGTFNRQVSQRIPGTTFSNIQERGDYDAVENARITLSDMRKLLHLWIIDIYNQSANRMTGKPPYALWSDSFSVIEPMLPESSEQLDLVLSREIKATLNHEGVLLKGLHYNSDELSALRIRNGGNAKITFRFNPNDLEIGWVYDPYHGEYIRVPCVHQTYAKGLTLRQHLLIRKQQRIKNMSLVDEEQLLIAKAKLLSLMREMSTSKKLSERKKAARLTTNLQTMDSNLDINPYEKNTDAESLGEAELLDDDWLNGPDFELMFRKDDDESL